MTYVIKNKRPTKRCRRGKNHHGSSINFNNLGASISIGFQINPTTNSVNMNISHLVCLLCLYVGIILMTFHHLMDLNLFNLFASISDYDSYAFLFPGTLNLLPPKLSKRALLRVAEFHGKGKQNDRKVCLRDIDRFFDRYENDQTALKKLRKENKNLRATVRRLKKKRLKQIIRNKLLLLTTTLKRLIPMKQMISVKQKVTFLLLLMMVIMALILKYLFMPLKHLKKLLSLN